MRGSSSSELGPLGGGEAATSACPGCCSRFFFLPVCFCSADPAPGARSRSWEAMAAHARREARSFAGRGGLWGSSFKEAAADESTPCSVGAAPCSRSGPPEATRP